MGEKWAKKDWLSFSRRKKIFLVRKREKRRKKRKMAENYKLGRKTGETRKPQKLHTIPWGLKLNGNTRENWEEKDPENTVYLD